MSTAVAAYLIAAAFQLRWNLSAEDAAERASQLWQQIVKRL